MTFDLYYLVLITFYVITDTLEYVYTVIPELNNVHINTKYKVLYICVCIIIYSNL